jgi:hypothetical protein
METPLASSMRRNTSDTSGAHPATPSASTASGFAGHTDERRQSLLDGVWSDRQ